MDGETASWPYNCRKLAIMCSTKTYDAGTVGDAVSMEIIISVRSQSPFTLKIGSIGRQPLINYNDLLPSRPANLGEQR